MRQVVKAAVVAIAIVAVSHVLIRDAQERHFMVGDSQQYLAMARGQRVPQPYATRLLAPELARWLPGGPELGLRAVTYFGLALAYACGIWSAQRLGAKLPAAALAAVTVAVRPGHLNLYADPFLTDGAAIGAIGAAVASIVAGSFVGLVAAAVIGVCAREPVAGAVLAWIPTRQWKRVAVAAVLVGSAWLTMRWLATDNGQFVYASPEQSAKALTVRAALVWNFVLLGGLGLLLVRDRLVRAQLLWLTAVFAAAGFVSVYLFTDTDRMLQPMAPMLIVGLALLYERMPDWAVAGCTLVSATSLLVIGPSALLVTNEDFPIKAATFVLGVALLSTAVRNRGSTRSG